MQSKVQIVTLVIVGMIAYTSAQCHLKQPMNGYNPELVKGKFYLVAVQKAFAYQNMEAHCGTSEIDDASPETFPYVITYQDQNGNLETINLSVKNASPPGIYNVSGADGTKFQASVLGAIQNKVHVFYACNPQNNKRSVWIYYASRVQGVKRMDTDSQHYVKRILANNNIPANDLQDIDNRNCNN